MKNYIDQYFHILKRVHKPSRYIGGEINQIVKDSYDIHFCLAFPDTYEIGMSHLGLRILYYYLNQESDIFCERVFAPWPDLEKELREHSLPLFSLETRTPLHQFDVVGFSLQYQLEYTNVLTILDVSGIPVFSRDRKDEHPIILAGGPVVFNPEPMADFIDAFIIGDGENIIPSILRKIRELKNRGVSRRDILQALTKFQGVYVPAFYPPEWNEEIRQYVIRPSGNFPYPIKKNLLPDLNQYPFPEKIIVPHSEIVHDRISVEIARGCTQGCRFCQAGYIYRPVRERSPESIARTIEESVKETGYRDVSLTSLSPADFSSIGDLVTYLVKRFSGEEIAFHLSSLRVYGLSRQIAEELSKVRKTGFTIAPEAGTQRMRDIINKNISEDDILTGARNAFENGWELIKLYTMFGLPFETDEDVEGIAEMAIQILRLGESIIGKRARVNLAVSTFVPQPFTPFQWVAFMSEEEYRRKKAILIDRLKSYKRIKFDFNHYRDSILEALLTRGDRSVGQVIYEAWKYGTRFDAWGDQIQWEAWEQAMKGLDLASLPQFNGYPVNALLPWDHIDPLIQKEFLQKEYQKAQKGRTTFPCEQPAKKEYSLKKEAIKGKKKYVCYNCGLNCHLPSLQEEQIRNLEYLERELEKTIRTDREFQQERVTYLFRFAKRKPLHMLSHLNLVQVLVRLFNRVKAPIAYSQGMRPKPLIVLARALALGIESEDEWGQVTLLQHFNEEELIQKLNQAAPEGLEFKEMYPLKQKLKMHEMFHYHIYRIYFNTEGHSLTEIETSIRSYSEKDRVILQKETPKGIKVIDFKPFVKITKWGVENDQTGFIEVELYSPQSGSVRLPDFLQTVFGMRDEEYRIVKIHSYPRYERAEAE
jgi:radical SAM family uncharacterized protein/radical SAM-linked protein